MPDAATLNPETERGKALEAGLKLAELRDLDPSKRGDTYAADAQAAYRSVMTADALYSLASKLNSPEPARGEGPVTATLEIGNRPRTLGEQLTANDGYEDFAKHGAHGSFSMEVRAPGDNGSPNMAEGGDLTTGPGLWIPRGQPFLGNTDRQRLYVRDLLASGNTTLSAIPYIREASPLVASGASSVAEGTKKPNVSSNFTADTALVQKIAAWISATTELLADAPTLRSYIDARLGYMINIYEEQQLLNGTGTTPQIKGIFQYTTAPYAVQTAHAVDLTISVASAAAKIELVDGVADGVAVNAGDFWAVISKRGSDGHFDVNPFVSADGLNLWGLTTVRTRSVPAGHAYVGAWKMGAQIFDRESMTMRVGDQHDQYFIYNQVAILVEERLALAVYRPDWFVDAQVP